MAYDPNYPLKRVVDFYALNIEQITADNFNSAELNHHGLRWHNQFLASNMYFISKLSGQPNNFHDDIWYTEEERTRYNAIVDVLRNWLNSFDFEHMSEMERAKKIPELLHKATYDSEGAATGKLGSNGSLYRVLVEHKGVCMDFAETAQLLAALVGLKHAMLTGATANHDAYAVQVDGVPYVGENGSLDLTQDWREKSWLGTKQTTNYHFGEYITYN